jgi:hypothetical protein
MMINVTLQRKYCGGCFCKIGYDPFRDIVGRETELRPALAPCEAMTQDRSIFKTLRN